MSKNRPNGSYVLRCLAGRPARPRSRTTRSSLELMQATRKTVCEHQWIEIVPEIHADKCEAYMMTISMQHDKCEEASMMKYMPK